MENIDGDHDNHKDSPHNVINISSLYKTTNLFTAQPHGSDSTPRILFYKMQYNLGAKSPNSSVRPRFPKPGRVILALVS